MSRPDPQIAVDLVVDRLARLSPSELMAVSAGTEQVEVDGTVFEIRIEVFDLPGERWIGAVYSETLLLIAGRRWVGGVKVSLQSARMSPEEAADAFD